MGAELSNPLDEAKQERIQETITDFVTAFGTIFPGSYKDALIEGIKEAAQGEEEEEMQLPAAPTEDSDLLTGTIIKVSEKFAHIAN